MTAAISDFDVTHTAIFPLVLRCAIKLHAAALYRFSAPVHLGVAVAVAVVAGLFIGSFLNVVAYRTPRGLSVSKPRSFCPACERQLTAWENVPVVSWLVLGGHCRTCGVSISKRYPLVEGGTAVAFGLVTLAWRGSLPSIGYWALTATLVAILLIDSGDRRAPLAVAAIGTAVGDVCVTAGAAWDQRWWTLAGAQIGLLVGAACFVVLRRLDPDCSKPQTYGRTALVPVGCWLGGLGAVAASVGFGAGGLAFLACLGYAARPTDGRAASLATRPLLVSLTAAAVIGLIGFR